MPKSYYAILGIRSSASQADVKTAYRRLAKELHPDHYRGADRPFLDVQEAYAVLGDPARRRHYDVTRDRTRRAELVAPPPRAGRRVYPGEGAAPEPLVPERGRTDLGEVSPIRSFETFTPSFDEIFDWLWSNFASLGPAKSVRVKNLTLEVPITREQAARGGQARIMVPARAACPTCRGHGGVGPYECVRCGGEGAITGEVPLSIAFPAGLSEDHAVVIPLDRYWIRNTRVTVLFRPTDRPSP